MNKYIYTALLTLSVVMIGYTNIFAQAYLRYTMKDDSYCGFYTSDVKNISHKVEEGTPMTIIQTSKKEYKIPVNDILDISFESPSLNTGDAGEYKVYLIKDLENDDTFFKEIYIDNRAGCLASKNGDFGANDIIVYTSAFNNTKVIMHTDSQERINMFYNGNLCLRLFYNDDGTIDIIDLSNNKTTTISDPVQATKGATSFTRFLKFPKFTQTMKENAALDYMEAQASAALSMDLELIQHLTDVLTQIESNPELHNQRLLLNSISLVGDLVGLGLSIGSLPASGGLTLPLVALQLYYIYNDLNSLLSELHPDEELMATYKEFYANKYGLEIQTLEATDITCTSATLNAQGYYEKQLSEGLSFNLELSEQEDTDISANATKYAVDSYEITGTANGLEPGKEYSYTIKYSCVVDGLKLEYEGAKKTFTTNVPSASIIEVYNIKANSASVKCEFYNPDGFTAGVEYYTKNDSENIKRVSSGGNGEKQVNLSGLEPNTTYICYAFIQDGDKIYKGGGTEFTTESAPLPDVSGTWNCIETHYYTNGEEYYETYSVTLYSDGTATSTKWESFERASWTRTQTNLFVKFILSTPYYTPGGWGGSNSGYDLSITFDNPENPTSGKGSACRWAVSAANGTGSEYSYYLEMSK